MSIQFKIPCGHCGKVFWFGWGVHRHWATNCPVVKGKK